MSDKMTAAERQRLHDADEIRRLLARNSEAWAEVARLRSELAETRDRRDYLQGQLDIIYDAEYSRNDALKRRIEKLGAAGDALADEVTAMLTGPVPDSGDWWPRLAPKVDAWRSVRGDAPTQPPAAIGYGLPDDAHWSARGTRELHNGDPAPFAPSAPAGRWADRISEDEPRARAQAVLDQIDHDRAAPAVARTDGQPTSCTACWFQNCARCTGWAGNNGMHGLAPCPCDHGQPSTDDEAEGGGVGCGDTGGRRPADRVVAGAGWCVVTGYDEAVAWFRYRAGGVIGVEGEIATSGAAKAHAATIVRAALAAAPAAPAGRDLTAQDVDDALHIDCPTNEQIAERLNRIARGAPERGDDEPRSDETIRLKGTILRLRESLADVPDAIAAVRDVWSNGSPEARAFLRMPIGGSWPDLAQALDTLCAISAGQKGSEHRAYELWAAEQDQRVGSLPAMPPDDATELEVWVSPDNTVTVRGEAADIVMIDEFFLPPSDAVRWGPVVEGDPPAPERDARTELAESFWDPAVIEAARPPAPEPQADEPPFAVGDRVRVKSTGRTGVLREIDSRGRHLIFGDDESWITGVRADNLEPAPEPRGYRKGFDDGVKYARDIDRTIARMTVPAAPVDEAHRYAEGYDPHETGSLLVDIRAAWLAGHRAALAASGAERQVWRGDR